ncbi:MAG: metal-dependent transcriptional regulator [Petrotogales bacterium]
MQTVSNKLTESMEDYLEAIVILTNKRKPVKVTEISNMLDVKKPSVTSALTKLTEANLVKHEKYGDVSLTEEGKRIGHEVYKRHQTLRRFLTEILNVDQEYADVDACRMEHVISKTSLERLTKFLDFVLNCPRGKAEWLEGLDYYFKHGKRSEKLIKRCDKKE